MNDRPLTADEVTRLRKISIEKRKVTSAQEAEALVARWYPDPWRVIAWITASGQPNEIYSMQFDAEYKFARILDAMLDGTLTFHKRPREKFVDALTKAVCHTVDTAARHVAWETEKKYRAKRRAETIHNNNTVEGDGAFI